MSCRVPAALMAQVASNPDCWMTGSPVFLTTVLVKCNDKAVHATGNADQLIVDHQRMSRISPDRWLGRIVSW